MTATVFLKDPELDLWQGQFSHDGRWVAFNATTRDLKSSRIYVVPSASTSWSLASPAIARKECEKRIGIFFSSDIRSKAGPPVAARTTPPPQNRALRHDLEYNAGSRFPARLSGPVKVAARVAGHPSVG
jgi:hypothetical protein